MQTPRRRSSLLLLPGLLLGLLLGLCLPLACGDDKGVGPNPPECPTGAPVSGATCGPELEKKSCYWDDAKVRLRTWCFCEVQSWNCFDE